jgi:hypothetical protein
MVRVKLIVSQHVMTRLVSPAMILGRYIGRWGTSAKQGNSDAEKESDSGRLVSPSPL